MYLSQLILNERQSLVHRELGNAHKFHQRIMQAFPDEDSRDNPREDWHILFRHEPDSDVVLVQSEIEPDWSKLPDRYLQDYTVKAVNFTADQFSTQRVFQFRLRANPSKRDPKTKKTIGFYHRPDQLAWLERQGDRCGFRLHSADVIPSPNVFGFKKKGVPPIRITTVLFQGVLEVIAPEPFLTVVQQGLGRGKSYGCGLLSLARPQ
ncbi:type I-E CRISPR-associated protein Cas6/Cse3/CasE [Candidatus Synechococcus calcipolaris G9]|uniref:Type I-E CRISPR-associated protein Cas6/Cse3/CasE n=1 Tax=Candidatus Synechococcus calcipolaris G9 TaxID=1497997 RepID=A0ABT6F131_9SYNE|nr:type I-E CRISPR-associated protein Cas6/Cse3/CasE [Candidatus Synechococcus calcipolaris]MDG2991560.1 type I-E CRISPR-associated protein Cas6/Cse3/CasE [Candidatus Synechococcus calcipolaris G9]